MLRSRQLARLSVDALFQAAEIQLTTFFMVTLLRRSGTEESGTHFLVVLSNVANHRLGNLKLFSDDPLRIVLLELMHNLHLCLQCNH